MDSDYVIFIVDDDKTTRMLLESMLGSRYAVEVFDSGEACMDRLGERKPNLLLLDVQLPGINGYALCRRIKAEPSCAELPVVFVSGHDNPADILAGYDAGGQDYVVKPFDVVNLYHKIENLQRIEQERQSLSGQAKASDELTSLVLANLDEYAALIKFLRRLSECQGVPDIVEAVMTLLDAYHLEGAIQVRLRATEKTFSHAGENWPLEIAVINHVRTLDRIFEFHGRAAFNFEHVTILVTNMPVADSDLCGRIRDDLAIAAESVDAKLLALQAMDDNDRMRGRIHEILQRIEDAVQSFGERYDKARYRGAEHTARFLDELLASFAHLGMTGQQEEEILDLVRQRSTELVDLYDVGGSTQATLAELSGSLEEILATTEKPVR